MVPNNIIQRERPLLFFDGVCNLCNASVQLVIRNDKKKIFLFSPLDSEKGRVAIANTIPTSQSGSVILLHRGKYYIKSSAALEVCRLMGGRWYLLYAFIVIPAFIRDWVYNWVARNRYVWFGKKDSCMLPSPETAARFV